VVKIKQNYMHVCLKFRAYEHLKQTLTRHVETGTCTVLFVIRL